MGTISRTNTTKAADLNTKNITGLVNFQRGLRASLKSLTDFLNMLIGFIYSLTTLLHFELSSLKVSISL